MAKWIFQKSCFRHSQLNGIQGSLALAVVMLAIPCIAEELSPSAREYIQKLPQQKISLEAVLLLGLKNSDSYERIQAQDISSEASVLDASAPLSWSLTAEGSLLDDQSAFRGFRAERTRVEQYRLTAWRAFLSGTQFQA